MIVKKGLLLCCICFSMCLLSCNHNNEVGVQDVTKDTVTSKTVPTVCLYTLGNVSKNLREAMLDSLKAHYPKCKYASWYKPTGEKCKKCGDLIIDKNGNKICPTCDGD